jgi:hypothetical protein
MCEACCACRRELLIGESHVSHRVKFQGSHTRPVGGPWAVTRDFDAKRVTGRALSRDSLSFATTLCAFQRNRCRPIPSARSAERRTLSRTAITSN